MTTATKNKSLKIQAEILSTGHSGEVPAQGYLIATNLVMGQTYEIRARGSWKISPEVESDANGVDAVRTSPVNQNHHPMRAAIQQDKDPVFLQRHILAGYPWGALTGLLIPSDQESMMSWLTGHIPLTKEWQHLNQQEILQIEHFFGQAFFVGKRSIVKPRFDANLILLMNDYIGAYHDNADSLTIQIREQT